ncbi:CAP domain-containing protein [Tamlana sp. 2201CG12-4]|uniref:CAP domain-containing protein n=1 Tax=Tamlana sp. 2201CG12-4 TaxID=3112582 RepID=UPI002DBA1C57|nr:CAP domain-containing protein [Tamlana sp. 2201CG12-4]MEC3907761.1 CAP domain-containing protein [Tamlana sp. 2201CG12-4]
MKSLQVILLVILTFSSCYTDHTDTLEETLELNLVSKEAKPIEIEILNLINQHRLTQGLGELESLSIIKSVAFSHTNYMVDNDVISHDNFFTRSDYLKTNADAKKVSENVAFGYSTAQGVVNAWIKSIPHKANLEGDFSNFDVSAEKNKNGRWYFTNIFIKK